jgi:hypothetical protein
MECRGEYVNATSSNEIREETHRKTRESAEEALVRGEVEPKTGYRARTKLADALETDASLPCVNSSPTRSAISAHVVILTLGFDGLMSFVGGSQKESMDAMEKERERMREH